MAINGSTTPLWEQLAIVFLGPPIMAFAWWLLSRGWGKAVQGGTVSEKTRHRQKLEFWFLLIVMYVISLGMVFYASLKR